MRKSKFSESQIAAILKEAEAGMAVLEVARKHGISAAM
jgi:putative transposase